MWKHKSILLPIIYSQMSNPEAGLLSSGGVDLEALIIDENFLINALFCIC